MDPLSPPLPPSSMRIDNMHLEDDTMMDQPMSVFSLDDRRCPCLLCAQGPPPTLQRDSVAWTSIIRAAFYVLHTIYPDLPYLSMKTHVSPYILRHWQALGIDKKGDNVKWKKHILDAIWHGDSFFESGTPVLKQTGVWRLINPKADPWLDSPTSSPVPRRKNMPPKKMRSSPSLLNMEDLPPQEFATSDPVSPLLPPRNLSTSSNIPQSLPHISHLLRHVDDYWNSRANHKSPPLHRRSTNMSYNPYRSPPLDPRFATSAPIEPRFATSSPTPGSPMALSPIPSPVPSVNLIPAINSIPTIDMIQMSTIPTITVDRAIPLSPTLPPSPPVAPRSHMLPHISFPSPKHSPLHDPTFTSIHAQSPVPMKEGNQWMHTSPPTRALHMLPCVSSLFQPPSSLPSILPTS